MPNPWPIISVGKSQQVTQNLFLIPNTTPGAAWTFVDLQSSPPQSANNIGVSFTSPACPVESGDCSTLSDREVEAAIITITLATGWTFATPPVTIYGGSDSNHDITTEIQSNGTALVATIKSLSSNEETIDYKFNAIYQGITYTSPDPAVTVGRPVVPR